MSQSVLFVSPSNDDARRLSLILRSLPVQLVHVPDLKQARKKLTHREFAAILTDTVLADGIWTDVLDLAREAMPGARVIVTDRLADSRLWAEVLNLGAYDLLPQPFYESEVTRILANACSHGAGSPAALCAAS